MRRWITRLLDRIRYGKIYQPTDWQREPEEVYVIQQLSPVKLPPVVHWKNGEWTRYYLEHPEVHATHKMALHTDLQRLICDEQETTERYQTPPKWVKS